MVPKSGQFRVLKEACQLTAASWSAILHLEGGTWVLGELFQLDATHRKNLAAFLMSHDLLSRVGEIPLGKRIRTFNAKDPQVLGCKRLYVIPISESWLFMVGFDGVMDNHNQRIWKLAATVEPRIYSSQPDVEVDLLQNTVMELELTQQELQARIAAQREAEARLIQAAKLAAVGEMASGVAHELNNPLTSVVGFTELALEEIPPNSPARPDLELVLQEARRARSVVRRLLDFARQSETVRVKADINEIVDDVLVLTRHFMQTSNVHLQVDLGENLSWAWVDRNQIKQVVINLVNNALYAMPNGGQITVETAEQSRYGQKWLTLSIRDTGIGIPAENMGRIFEPFFTTRGDHGGTGLGLSVTYGIVTDHGGMIEFESQVNIGSTFVVWLPLDPPS